MRHRPIGLGVMGLQDALYQRDIAFSSPEALAFADEAMEKIAYHAIMASSQLAAERGTYESYKGSKWDRGLFPQDTIAMLEQERQMKIEPSSALGNGGKLDWAPVRAAVKAHGVRNSNLMAIAPTATISTIAGTVPSIEPIYKNIYVKANMSGEFTVVNSYLVQDLKKYGLWNSEMLDQLKYYDGQLGMIGAIPQHLKVKYQEAFDVDPVWLLKITAARGKWTRSKPIAQCVLEGVFRVSSCMIFICLHGSLALRQPTICEPWARVRLRSRLLMPRSSGSRKSVNTVRWNLREVLRVLGSRVLERA